MKGYEFLPHTADVYIAAYGCTLEEAFENAAKAMMEVMTDPNKVRAEKEVEINVEGHDLESLLYNWLEELLYIFETEGLIFSKFQVLSIKKLNGKYLLKAKAWGEKFNPEVHESRTLVKAATYNLMEIKKDEKKCTLKFVLDI